MKRWYRTTRDANLKNGHMKIYHLVFETNDKSIVEKIEHFFYDLMDARSVGLYCSNADCYYYDFPDEDVCGRCRYAEVIENID